MGIQDRFYAANPTINCSRPVLPMVVYQSTTQVSTGDAETKNVANLVVPSGSFPPGSTFRITMTGTKTGANGTLSAVVSINSTAILTVDADADTAVDWMAILYVVSASPKVQKCFGQILTDTEDAGIDYAAGAVDCSGEFTLRAQMANEHASDDITCEVCVIEYWCKAD
jgi:hypothetical protein